MTKNEKELSTSKLKPYQIIIMSCLLVTLMMLNSYYVNEKRALKQINIEKSNSLNEFVSLRKLDDQQNNSGNKNSDKVCSMGSKDLVEYYKTGDLSEIGLDDDGIKCEDKDKDYMKALISLVRKNIGDDDDDNDNADNTGDNAVEENTEKSEEGSNKDNLMKYGRRILPMAVFLIIGFLSIIGWFICCFCNCCNCCCCCCCKKPGCKIPCFIFTYAFYALVVAVSIYGLSQSNKIFEGLANTECSILKLLEQVVDGEIKQTTPRWAGIAGINTLLTSLKNNINTSKNSASSGLTTKKGAITTAEGNFTTAMNTFDTYCYNGGAYPSAFTHTFSGLLTTGSIYEGKTYVLDIIKSVGHEVGGAYPQPSFLYDLNYEYQEVASTTNGYIQRSENSFNDILDTNSDKVIKALDKAKKTLDDFKKPFDEINNKIGDKVADYAELIDEKGKLVVKLVFGVLMVMNIALAVFLMLIGLFSMKACTNCCFCRCIFKCGVHILWNVLALLMILTFLVGSILALIGRIGGDAMSLVSFILSKENFENQQNPLLLGKMGDAKKYLKVCLHGDGNLESEFDLGNSLNSINDIDNVLSNLEDVKTRFNAIINDLPTIKSFKNEIKDRKDFLTDEFGLFYVDDSDTNPIILRPTLRQFNEEVGNYGKLETWGIGTDRETDKSCETGTSGDSLAEGNNKFHIIKCKPADRDWINLATASIKDYAEIITKIVDLTGNLDSDPFNDHLTDLEGKYGLYMESYIRMIEYLEETIEALIGELRDTVGNGSLFSFLNGKFIGTNIKIILKYLKYSLGQDLYTVGLCLIIVGCSLILSISSTILLNVIINISLENAKKAEQAKVSAYQINSAGQGMAPVY